MINKNDLIDSIINNKHFNNSLSLSSDNFFKDLSIIIKLFEKYTGNLSNNFENFKFNKLIKLQKQIARTRSIALKHLLDEIFIKIAHFTVYNYKNKSILRDINDNFKIVSTACTEENFDKKFKTTVKYLEKEDKYILNGFKPIVSFGEVADYLIVYCDNLNKDNEYLVFIVESNESGVNKIILENKATENLFASQYEFNNVKINPENLITKRKYHCKKDDINSYLGPHVKLRRLLNAYYYLEYCNICINIVKDYVSKNKRNKKIILDHPIINIKIYQFQEEIKKLENLINNLILKDLNTKENIKYLIYYELNIRQLLMKIVNETEQYLGLSGYINKTFITEIRQNSLLFEVRFGTEINTLEWLCNF